MEKLPKDHHIVNSFIIIKAAAEFIDFLKYVFDGEESQEMRIPDCDGSLIHSEVTIGDSTLLIADRKEDWVFTPALTQVYVEDAEQTLQRAVKRGGQVVTPVSKFYGNYDIARFTDPWHNLWWLFTPASAPNNADQNTKTDWHDREPSRVYTTLMEVMRELKDPIAHE